MRERLAAIALADARIRFRRTSTVVVFLLLSAIAYLWVPDPSTGRALLNVGGRRAVYDSAAIGTATALLGTLFVGLIGFYVVSNALRRDAQSRCGAIIAATPVRSGEYIAGKFLGNILFLATFFGGFMLVSMAMVIVRGEASLRPFVFVKPYLLLAPSSIVFVSALAILFECVPWLSGRFGDVLYFFVFMMSLAMSTAVVVGAGKSWGAYVDPTGMAAVIVNNIAVLHTKTFAIGASAFDPHKPPIVYPGLAIGFRFLLQRLASMLVPLPLLFVARASFHRFDPVRVRVAAKGERRLLGRLNALLKPLTRPLMAMPAARSLPLAALADAQLTIALLPPIALAIAAAAIASFAFPPAAVLPALFAVMAISIADVASRDVSAGTVALLHSAPRLREHFVAWKTMSASIIALAFIAVALVRTGAAFACLTGAFLTVAAATALGIISGNAKTFIVVFLSFWYIVINDKGATPALDFAGFYGKATPAISAAYAAIAVALLVVASAVYRWTVRRR